MTRTASRLVTSLKYALGLGFVLAALSLVPLRGAMASDNPSSLQTIKTEEVSFTHKNALLRGTLFQPVEEKLRGAAVVLAGSDRSRRGPLRLSLGRHLAACGVAALVYDSPGTGASTGNALLQSRQDRVDETLAAVDYLQEHPGIPAAAVGIFGGSEGADVALMAAAQEPDVAFVIAVSGSMGGSVLDLLRYSAEKRGQALGMSLEEISKAVTFKEITFAFFAGVDMLEWKLIEARTSPWQNPHWEKLFRIARQRQQTLSDPQKHEVLVTLRGIVDAFKTEPWFAVADIGNTLQRLVTMDSKRFLLLLESGTLGQDWDRRLYSEIENLKCPVLGIWGEEDTFLPPRQSAARLKKYLSDADHRAYTIRIFPGAGHGLTCTESPAAFVPGYLDTIRVWLGQHLGPPLNRG